VGKGLKKKKKWWWKCREWERRSFWV